MVAQAETELLQTDVDAAQRPDQGYGFLFFPLGLFLDGTELHLKADQIDPGGQGGLEPFGDKDIGREMVDLLVQELQLIAQVPQVDCPVVDQGFIDMILDGGELKQQPITGGNRLAALVVKQVLVDP